MFTVFVDDNFHFSDEDERYKHGEFETYPAAVAAAKAIVEASLKGAFQPGMKAEELFEGYQSFGEDPFIEPEPKDEHFSAWDYARQRSIELCGS